MGSFSFHKNSIVYNGGNPRVSIMVLLFLLVIFERRNIKMTKWIKEHKTEVIVGSLIGLACIGSFAFGYMICKHDMESKAIIDSVTNDLDLGELPDKCNQKIDEDIFTSLAPEIENAVLDDGNDECLIKRVYDVTCPRFGNWDKGSYNIVKEVSVLVRDVG